MEQRFNNSLRLSVNEKKFIETALRSGLRVDGRRPFDYRDLTIEFGSENGSSEVHLGQTYVAGLVTSQLVQPYRDRPDEGFLSIYSEFSPMADPSFEAGRPGESAVELGRIIDRGLRESRSVDTESLCVVPGKFVWAIRVDLHILDNCGNLVDAANIAALAALLAFRRPECTLSGEDEQDVIMLPPEVKDPIPLIIHHLPIAVTFAFVGEENTVVIDPTHFEEAVMGGRMTATLNISGDVCALQKAGGEGVTQSVIMQCLRIASVKAADITTKINNAVEVYNSEREQKKVKCDHSAGLVDICESSHVNDPLLPDAEEMDMKKEHCAFDFNDDTNIKNIQHGINQGYSEPKSTVRGPLSWDPYAKGIDLDELKVSLASIASSDRKPETLRTDEKATYDRIGVVQNLLPVEEGNATTATTPLSSNNKKLATGGKPLTNRALTLEDAVKPEHQRRRRKVAH